MARPSVSVVIPTLNAASVLEPCLKSISEQDYSKKDLEIIIADGGSTDETLRIAEKYNARIVENPLKTAEAGKAVGVREAKGEYIALIDSDNILPTDSWLTEMINPLLENPNSVGSEPWEYTWRKQDGFITRYCALIGMNDPFVHFLGNYDRMNLLTGTWTEVERDEVDVGKYLKVQLYKDQLPTIGANGTMFRAEFLKNNLDGDYLFDIDILARYLEKNGIVEFIKTKNGIIHTFCERNVLKFAKKQRRRVRDYLFHSSEDNRQFKWKELDLLGTNPGRTIWFILYCITFFPLVVQSIRGFIKKPDIAWFFHPLACEITLWEYGWGRIMGIFKKEELDRKDWGQ